MPGNSRRSSQPRCANCEPSDPGSRRIARNIFPLNLMTPAISKKSPEEVLHSLVNAAYDRAKFWAGFVHLSQTVLFVGGVVAVFTSRFSLAYPWVAVPVAMICSILAAYASECKGLAESLKRRLENWSGFGRPLSTRMLADFRQKLPGGLAPEFDQLLREGNTYASPEQPGPRRSAQNLSESAWFSHHLAGWCASALGVILFLTLCSSLSLLLYSAISVPSTTAAVLAAKCISATLLFMLSGGAWRAWRSYMSFSTRAKEIAAEAADLAAEDATDVGEVQRLWGEYQLARASAPLIPTWVWRLRRRRLDEDHKNFRTLQS